jgi:hypothetical protein|tara:strand:- start:381 stop:575 length:195 start_codon:yes stop_codon:yes gene_type:complete
MSNIKNKIIEETVETIIDNLEDKLVDYMYEYGNYSESDNKFYSDKEELFSEVIKEISNRLVNTK